MPRRVSNPHQSSRAAPGHVYRGRIVRGRTEKESSAGYHTRILPKNLVKNYKHSLNPLDLVMP